MEYKLCISGIIGIGACACLMRCEKENSPSPAPHLDPPCMVSVSTGPTAPFVNVQWRPSPSAAGYVVFRKANDDSAYAPVDTVTDTSYLDLRISASSLYRYAVVAVHDRYASEPSSPDSAFTDPFLILSPRQGDTVLIGDTVRAVFSAAESRTAGIALSLDAGKTYRSIRPINSSGTFVPAKKPEVTFVVPPFFVTAGNPGDTVRSKTSSARLRLFDYSSLQTLAESYGLFVIK